MNIVVCYATPDVQDVVELDLPAGATVADAVRASGMTARRPELLAASTPVGIWGRPADPGRPLRDGDRVELYRPLQADPREARRAMAERARAHSARRPSESARILPEGD